MKNISKTEKKFVVKHVELLEKKILDYGTVYC